MLHVLWKNYSALSEGLAGVFYEELNKRKKEEKEIDIECNSLDYSWILTNQIAWLFV